MIKSRNAAKCQGKRQNQYSNKQNENIEKERNFFCSHSSFHKVVDTRKERQIYFALDGNKMWKSIAEPKRREKKRFWLRDPMKMYRGKCEYWRHVTHTELKPINQSIVKLIVYIDVDLEKMRNKNTHKRNDSRHRKIFSSKATKTNGCYFAYFSHLLIHSIEGEKNRQKSSLCSQMATILTD